MPVPDPPDPGLPPPGPPPESTHLDPRLLEFPGSRTATWAPDDRTTLPPADADESASRPTPRIEPDSASGRYRIGPEIGRGGVGVIHRAWDTRLQREVALKLLAPHLVGRPAIVQRFLDEARITGRLQHPGVVPVHDLGTFADGRPYFAMNLVQGETLEQILSRRAQPDDDLGPLLSSYGKVCETIAHAHANDVIHRDLKPSNIMVGPFGIVLVMDWGLAKRLGSTESPSPPISTCGDPIPRQRDPAADKTLLGAVFGTPAYLAPEQARGEIDHVDRRADVFGLGAILCEMLTGLPPFTASNVGQVLRHAIRGDVAAARERLRACRAAPSLIDLAYRCLSPDRADRPASAVEVSAIVSDYLQSEHRRAERELVRFFDLSLDLFAIVRLDGVFERVNANFARVLGYDAQTLTSRPFLDFLHPDDREATARVYDHVLHGSVCTQFLNRYRHARGHYLWFEWNALLVPEERAVYAVARDVTERVAILEAQLHTPHDRRQLEAVADSPDVASLCTTLDGVVVAWNAGAERLFGFRSAEIIGRSVDLLLPDDDHAQYADLLARLARCERVDLFESLRRHKDGHLLVVSVTISPIRDESGRVLGVSNFMRELAAPSPLPPSPRSEPPPHPNIAPRSPDTPFL